MAAPQPEQDHLPSTFGLDPLADEFDSAGAESSSPAKAPSSGIGSPAMLNSSKSGASSIGGASLAVCISGTGCSAFSASLFLP